MPAPTVENAIQGQVPGALIAQNNGGAPGGGMQVQIRGITSINANASPLYVLDGVIIDNDIQEPGNNAITFATAQRRCRTEQPGPRRQPHRRPQPGRHREHRGPEGCVGVGHLRLQGVGRRGDHHDQEGQGGQAGVEPVAEGRAVRRLPRRSTSGHSRRWPARRRGTTTTSPVSTTRRRRSAANNAFIASRLRGTAGLSEHRLRQRAGLVRDGPERQRHAGSRRSTSCRASRSTTTARCSTPDTTSSRSGRNVTQQFAQPASRRAPTCSMRTR